MENDSVEVRLYNYRRLYLLPPDKGKPEQTHSHMIQLHYKRKVNVYAKGTRTNLQTTAKRRLHQDTPFLLSCVSILFAFLSLQTNGCDHGLTQEHPAGVLDVFLDLEGVSCEVFSRMVNEDIP
jgi:hypothetical protein